MRLIRLTILTLTLLRFSGAVAQQVAYVAEKVVERTFDVEDVTTLELNSEKAEVIISRGEVGKVSVKLTFTSSHPKKDIATAELRFHKYAFGHKGSTFFIDQTYYLGNDVDRVLSKLSAKMELVIPPGMNVIAVGEYTDFALREGNGSNDFRMHFGRLILQNIAGPTKVDTNYGDVEINQCTGKTTVVARRSEIVLRTADAIMQGVIRTENKEQILNVDNYNIRNTAGTIRLEKSEP